VLVSAGCNPTTAAEELTPTPAFTVTPERLVLINGELEACLLVPVTEFEAISGQPVTSEMGFISDPTVCRFVSVKNGEVLAVVTVMTDTTLKKANKSFPAVEMFEMSKFVDSDMAEREPELFKIQELADLGDQAYSKDRPYINSSINILQNGILYLFSTDTIEDGGIGYDGLIEMAKLALRRAP
jgi:hypothetical protein